jgi:hypothetical protein
VQISKRLVSCSGCSRTLLLVASILLNQLLSCSLSQISDLSIRSCMCLTVLYNIHRRNANGGANRPDRHSVSILAVHVSEIQAGRELPRF